MEAWAKLTPDQRRQARENYRDLSQLPPQKKQDLKEKWVEYQSLSPEEKRRLGTPPGDAKAAERKSRSKPRPRRPPRRRRPTPPASDRQRRRRRLPASPHHPATARRDALRSAAARRGGVLRRSAVPLRQRRARIDRLAAHCPAGVPACRVRGLLPLVLAARWPDAGDEGVAHPAGRARTRDAAAPRRHAALPVRRGPRRRLPRRDRRGVQAPRPVDRLRHARAHRAGLGWALVDRDPPVPARPAAGTRLVLVPNPSGVRRTTSW